MCRRRVSYVCVGMFASRASDSTLREPRAAAAVAAGLGHKVIAGHLAARVRAAACRHCDASCISCRSIRWSPLVATRVALRACASEWVQRAASLQFNN